MPHCFRADIKLYIDTLFAVNLLQFTQAAGHVVSSHRVPAGAACVTSPRASRGRRWRPVASCRSLSYGSRAPPCCWS